MFDYVQIYETRYGSVTRLNISYCPLDFHPSYLDTPEFFTLSLHILSILALPFHIFGAYCILFKTPKPMISVKFILLNFHIWTFLIDIMFSFLGRPFILVPIPAMILYGVLGDLGLDQNIQGAVGTFLLETMLVAILLIVENRYFNISNNSGRWRDVRKFWIAANYIGMGVSGVPLYLKIPRDQAVWRIKVLENLPCLLSIIAPHQPIFVLTNDNIFLLFRGCILYATIGIQVLIFSRLTRMATKGGGARVSERTLRLQKQLIRALNIQLIIPILSLVGPFIYVISSFYFKFYFQKINNLCMIILASHGFLSTILMLFVHTAYRKVIVGYIGNLRICFGGRGDFNGNNMKNLSVAPSIQSNISYCPLDFHPSFLDTPEFYALSLHILSILALPIHIFGAYCILFKTPKSMISVKFALLNFHIWTFLIDIMFSFLGRPFVLVPSPAAILYGVMDDLGMNQNIQGVVGVFLVETMLVAILLIVENRYFNISNNSGRWRNIRKFWIAANYIGVAVSGVPLYLKIPRDQAAERVKVLVNLPCLITIIAPQQSIFVLTNDNIFLLFRGCILYAIIGIQVLIFSRLTRMATKRWGARVSEKTLRLQKQLIRALNIQLIVPILSLVGPFIYVISSFYFKFYFQKINNFCLIIVASHGFLSTILMLFVHTAYRKVIFGYIGNLRMFFGGRGDFNGNNMNNLSVAPSIQSVWKRNLVVTT
ncbi:unnamed protein product [Caenorhabditis brenneri]